MNASEYVADLVAKARVAQKQFETYSQEKVDEAVRAIGKAVFDDAEAISRMAVEETGMGLYEDKLAKNLGKAKGIWAALKGKKSRGVIRHIEEEGLTEVGKPIGVIGAVTPVTNPTSTPMHNAMISLKGGNAIIVCPHPRAKACGKVTVDAMNKGLRAIGAPENLIQIVENPTLEITTLVMKSADVCISTGGPAMVKTAYSSGKPAFGVGPGNIQCLIGEDADIPDAVAKIIRGRTYDNGILCTCDQTAICPRSKVDEIVREFVANGCYFAETPEDVAKVRNVSFVDGVLNKDLVGAKPDAIAKAAGLTIAPDAKLIMAKLEKCGADEPLAREKLFPVLGLYAYDTWEQAVDIAVANILHEGIGHSAVIHSFNKDNIEYAALRIPVSRFSVNQPGSNSLGGSFVNGLNPTLTLGCGSWGNNSISENLWYTHLINISRIAYLKPGATIPSDEEVWGE